MGGGGERGCRAGKWDGTRERERDGGVTGENKRGWGSIRGRVEGEGITQEGEVMEMESERLFVSSISHRLNDFFK